MILPGYSLEVIDKSRIRKEDRRFKVVVDRQLHSVLERLDRHQRYEALEAVWRIMGNNNLLVDGDSIMEGVEK